MDGTRFDDLARSVAMFDRRKLLKGLAAGIGGAITGLAASTDVLADKLCKPAAKKCNKDAQCCRGLVCASGACKAGCRISGSFYAAGTGNPANQCQTCQPAISTTGWTNAARGVACDDGNLCTRTDICDGAGQCVGGNAVVCTAQDQCHAAGICNPATGACSNPNLLDGVSCNDGHLCTTGDTCQQGVCRGGASVVCTAVSACMTATCVPESGCVETPKERGAPCDDGNPCNGSEACDGRGTCVGGVSVACPPPGQCQVGGVCDPETGGCSYDNRPNGTSCDTGNACTADICQNGVCVQGVDAVTPTCPAGDQCHEAGICDPLTGQCTNQDKSDGAICNDGNACTGPDVCQAGICTGAPIDGCCETFADCPEPPPGNTCQVRVCGDGRCGYRYLPPGFSCFDEDPCVTSSVCVSSGFRDFTFCSAETYSTAAACQFPCDTASDCFDQADQCQEMVCIYDPEYQSGGCHVVANADANGAPCTRDDRTGAPNDERLCVPNGTCANGTCSGGDTYTCSPSPEIMCCFGQKEGCGLGNGLACASNGQCCSDNCVGGICAA